MPRPSQVHVEGLLWISDFPAEPAAFGVSSAMTPNLLPQLASVALPAGYAVSLNIRCMGADVRAGLLQCVGVCLRWNRVSFTSLSTFLPPRAPDLHLACGAGRISRDRFRKGQCVSRSPIETPRTSFVRAYTITCLECVGEERWSRLLVSVVTLPKEPWKTWKCAGSFARVYWRRTFASVAQENCPSIIHS